MAQEKTYYCPVEVTLDVIGGKWKCIILWWLRRGPKRFSELKQLIPKVSRQVLTSQLRQLEADGLVNRQAFREAPPRVEYSLTDHGKTIRPITEMMCDWGRAHLPDYPFSFKKLVDLRILLVGDDEALRDRIQQGLALCDARLTAVSAAVALSSTDLTQVDVAIVDLDPASADSTALAQRFGRLALQAGWSGIAIALTSETPDLPLGRGFQIHLVKPIDIAELVGAISIAVEDETLSEDR